MLRIGVLVVVEVATPGVRELASHFGRDLVMRVLLDELEQSLFLLARYVRLVALHERQQRLMPQHGQLARVALKSSTMLFY